MTTMATREAYMNQTAAAATPDVETPAARPVSTLPLPPGPRGRFLVGNLHEMVADRLGFVTQLHTQYGGVVHYRVGRHDIINVTNPSGVQHVLQGNNHNYSKQTSTYGPVRWVAGNGLFTSDGDFWFKQRRLMQPAFHRQRIPAFGEMMTAHAAAMADRWQVIASTRGTLDIAHDMTELTLEIAVKALFGSDIDRDVERLTPAISLLLEFVTFNFQHPFYPGPSVPTPRNLRYRAARRTVDEAVNAIIRERKLKGDDGTIYGDLLDMLLGMRDEESGEGMTHEQLRDEVMTLLLAGHETTAGMLTWAWYLLSKHPEVARRLHSELDSVLGGRLPTAADLPNLTWTRMILDETLRLYPPIWMTNRLALGEDEIDGYRIPPGAIVAVVPWVTHRLPEFWENPEGFDPERFSAENKAKQTNFSYFPFGGGPRFCIGQSFALMEGTLALATLAQRYDLELAPGPRVQIAPAVTLRPLHGMTMRPRARC